MKKIIIYVGLSFLLIVFMIGIKSEVIKIYDIRQSQSLFKEAIENKNYSQAYIEAGNVANTFFKHNDMDNYRKWKIVQEDLSKNLECPY